MAHFFVSVCGSEIRWRVAQKFIDIHIITYRDISKKYQPIGIFTVHEELNSIIRKIQPFVKDKSLGSIAFVASKFNTEKLFRDYPQYQGHERRMSSNVLSFECFNDQNSTDAISVYGIYGKKRTKRYIDIKYVDTADGNIEKFKIVMPKADGNGAFGDVLTMPEVLPPHSGFTHTFLGMGGFATKGEAQSVLSYIKTKFARALLSVLKVTQDINADKWKLVPLQDFTPASDIDWSKSIPEIDQQLYRKYGLDQTEIDFIESHVKEMT